MPESDNVIILASRKPRSLSRRHGGQEASRASLAEHPGHLRLNPLQIEVLRGAQRRWGAVAGLLKALVEAETRKLDEWLHRLPYYFGDPSDLVHCRPLPVKRIRHQELCRHALADPLGCWLLVLVAHRGPILRSDREGIDYGVPWLSFIREGALLASDLVMYRCAYLAVEEPRLARALFDNIPRAKVARTAAHLFHPQGELIAGEPLL